MFVSIRDEGYECSICKREFPMGTKVTDILKHKCEVQNG